MTNYIPLRVSGQERVLRCFVASAALYVTRQAFPARDKARAIAVIATSCFMFIEHAESARAVPSGHLILSL